MPEYVNITNKVFHQLRKPTLTWCGRRGPFWVTNHPEGLMCSICRQARDRHDKDQERT